MSVLHLFRVPSLRFESVRVIPEVWVIVDVMQGRDNDCVSMQFVAAREDHVDLGRACRLEGRVVSPLRFLDEFVEEG